MNNYALALQGAGHYDDALIRFEKAVKIDPGYAQAQWNLGVACLLQGDFGRGWAGAEWRLKMDQQPPLHLGGTPWQGEAIEGKTILLHTEQGFGDAIQFARYMPMVKAMGAKIVFPCPPPLANLFRSIDAIDVLLENNATLPPFDFHASLMSLPHIFKTTIENIPASVPYLHADPEKQQIWQNALAGLKRRKIGITWRGRPTHKNDRNRSMTAEQFTTMLSGLDADFILLQKDVRDDELNVLHPALSIYNPTAELTGFADTAALIGTLDSVISVDTAICHLAGALGKPIWTLLPFVPDWRWLLNREDTPWYPTMRLFRQPSLNDWESVMRSVHDALAG
jgi:ADP-heptose:LPS heptosyltransferase